ncbi:hypothetical protein M441DRAFT_53613 [Trichoderma asperellum CBS 433.97]|uniref:Uncharacterized protein n=1 Tax=Trichoderma asperellum (strain ATCC 204424 / CBS 433.97 / NBRC 101777) TaxID=1042311 RepID=A0A2T3ZQ64_TRIA4|nr:hypothetical protein M441DRAFT_53613 [Trichoderma asperellum CBS 433.97]PTB46924.1 hypothetical protein M441DRAFT_53613 [Trichoderma asperellum CBS 433.97]
MLRLSGHIVVHPCKPNNTAPPGPSAIGSSQSRICCLLLLLAHNWTQRAVHVCGCTMIGLPQHCLRANIGI